MAVANWITQNELLLLGNMSPADIAAAEAARAGSIAISITAASELASSKAAQRYPDVQNGQDVVVDTGCKAHIAAVVCWWIRTKVLGLDPQAPAAQNWGEQYLAAMKFWDDVAQGHASPVITPTTAPDPTTATKSDEGQVAYSQSSPSRWTNQQGSYRRW